MVSGSQSNDSYTTENEQRFTRLECGMAELQAQGTQFRQWFEESGTRMALQDQQLPQLQTAMTQQQQDLICTFRNSYIS